MTAPLIVRRGQGPNGAPLLAVLGQIDMSNAAVLAEALAGTDGSLILDLTGVEYIDSAGLNVLFTHASRVEIIAPALLMPLLAISGLPEISVIHTGPPDELKAGDLKPLV